MAGRAGLFDGQHETACWDTGVLQCGEARRSVINILIDSTCFRPCEYCP
jgi:hypothetical protein